MKDSVDSKGNFVRSEFSNFAVKSCREYFKNLILSADQKKRMEKMIVIPFGSVARGDASEISSDLDLIFFEDDLVTYAKDIMPYIDGSCHKDKIALGRYILLQYQQNDPHIREERQGRVRPEYIDEIEVDMPHPQISKLLDSIVTNTLDDETSGNAGHTAAVLLGLILNASLDILIHGNLKFLYQLRSRINTYVEKYPTAKSVIEAHYEHFLNWSGDDD